MAGDCRVNWLWLAFVVLAVGAIVGLGWTAQPGSSWALAVLAISSLLEIFNFGMWVRGSASVGKDGTEREAVIEDGPVSQ